MKTVDRDVVSGSGLIVLGIIGFIGANDIENMVVTKLSGAFFPCVLFTIIILCGATLIFQGIKRVEKQAIPTFKCWKLVKMIIALGLYVFLMEYLGFIIATIFFLVIAMWLFGERRKKILILLPIMVAIIAYLLFAEAFMIVLPGIPGLDI